MTQRTKWLNRSSLGAGSCGALVVLLACGPLVSSARAVGVLPAAIAATDTVSGVPVTCTDFRSGFAFSVRAQHVLGNGTIATGWIPDGSRLCLGSAQEVSSVLVADGSGGAYVIWVDGRSGDADLYAQHLTSTGAPAAGWSSDGRALCTARYAQYQLSACADGAGGALVAWQDYRAGHSGDIYVQRMLATGEPAWGTDGIAVASDSADDAVPTLAADGSGGALVVWQRGDGTLTELRAAHVAADGSISPASGGALGAGAGAGERRNPKLSAGPDGSAYLVWEDLGTGTSAMWATRLDMTGHAVPGWPPSGVPLCALPGEQRLAVSASAGADLADSTSSRAGRAGTGAGAGASSGASSRTTCTLVPPIPKELTPARRGSSLRGQGRSSVFT